MNKLERLEDLVCKLHVAMRAFVVLIDEGQREGRGQPPKRSRIERYPRFAGGRRISESSTQPC
jgi:thioredoxin reductase